MSTDLEGEATHIGPHEENSPRSQPTRRQVLAGAGVLAGGVAIAASPLLRSLFASLSATFEPRVGLVIPRSDRFPTLAADIRNGVVSGLGAAGRSQTRVLTREADRSPSAVAAVAAELIDADKVDIVLAWANPARAQALGDLAEKTRTPIVVIQPGAHIVTKGDRDPRVLEHSLGGWQAAWALGGWSASAVGRTCFVVSSLYESGFDTFNAFAHGFERAGGRIAGCAVTHAAPGDVASALARCMRSGADLTLSLHTGDEAREFVAAYADSALGSNGTLAVAGLALPALAADGSRLPRRGVVTCAGWPVDDARAIQSGPFFALGHDIGALVADAASDGARAIPSGDTAIDSRRGHLRVDLARGVTNAPLAIHRLTRGATGPAATKVAEAGRTRDANAFTAQILPAMRTGWLDVYGSAT